MANEAVRAAWVLILILPAGARADTVFLKNQGTIKNCRVMKEEPGKVHLRTPGGQMGIPREEVVRIEKEKSVFDEYDERRAKLGEKDWSGHLKLAEWCRDEACLREEADMHLRKVISLKGDHLQARRLLGYVKDGRDWHLPPPLSVRLSFSGMKEFQDEADRQFSIILPTRGDLQPVSDLKGVKALNGLELSVTVEVEEREKVTFYGQETQRPTTVAKVTIQAVTGRTGERPPSIVLEGAVLSAIPGAKTLSVGDAFTSHVRELHAFFDRVDQERRTRIEAVLARRNEEKKMTPATDPSPPAPRPAKKDKAKG